MTQLTPSERTDTIHVLHVDDEPEFSEMAAKFLKREDDRFDITTATTVSDGLERFQHESVDCIVSDYEMSDQNGLEFLQTVREAHPEFPFILYTGKGSEELASEAISEGVTDYLQKSTDRSQYTVLANRITNAVEQYNAKQTLKKSTERLSLFFEQSPLGVIEWNEDFEFARVNDTAVDILGYPEAELLGESWEVIVPRSDETQVDQTVSALLSNEAGYKSVNRNIRKDGSEIICEWHNRVVTDDDGAVVAIFSMFQDITEQQEHKEELTEITRRLELTLERTNTGIWEWDLQTDAVTWNETVERSLGLSPGEFEGTLDAFIDRIHPDDLSRVEAEIDNAIETGSTYNTEFRMQHTDGDFRWIAVRGELVHDAQGDRMVGVHHDITERKEQERERERIIDRVTDGIIELDSAWRFTLVNEQAEELVALDEDALLGQEFWEVFSEGRGTRFETEYREVMENRTATSFVEYYPELDEWFDVTAYPKDDGGIALYFTEVTERYERQRELERQNERFQYVEAAGQIGYWEIDVQSEQPYDVTLSDGVYRVHDLPPDEEFDIEKGLQFYHPQDRPKVREAVERAVSEGVPYDLEVRLITATDRERWVHSVGEPVERDGEITKLRGVFQDITDRKRHEARTVGWNETLSECFEATSKQQICEIITENACDRLDLSLVAFGLFDNQGGLRPVARSQEANTQLRETALFDQEDGTAWTVFATGESTAIEDSPEDMLDLPSDNSLFIHPLGRSGVFIAGARSTDEEFTRSVSEDIRLIFDRLDREEQLQTRDELLEEQNESLNRLNRINKVIRNIVQALVHASTRDEIEQAVCKNLIKSDTYTFAWIGDYDPTAGQITPLDWAGHQQGYLETASFSVESDEPTAAAVQAVDPVVINELLADPPHDDWRDAALKRGYRSLICVPLLYGDSLYGTLTAYSDKSGQIDEMEQRVLMELGETIGHAINAVESKRALVSDTVVELKLSFDASAHPIGSYLEQDSARKFELESVVPTTDGSYRALYFVHGVEPADYLTFSAQTVAFRDSQLISEHEDGGLYESILSEGSVLFWMIDRGGVPTSCEITGNGGRVTVELPGDVDVREFSNLFKSEYPGSELLAKHDGQRNIGTARDFNTQLQEHLTDRQREILQLAYFSGYFETPRKRTGKAIADSLGVSAPTVSGHIRSGLDSLLELLYEGDARVDPKDA